MSRNLEDVINQLLSVLEDDSKGYELLKNSKELILESQKFSAPECANGWKKLVGLMNDHFRDHPKGEEISKILSGK